MTFQDGRRGPGEQKVDEGNASRAEPFTRVPSPAPAPVPKRAGRRTRGPSFATGLPLGAGSQGGAVMRPSGRGRALGGKAPFVPPWLHAAPFVVQQRRMRA